MRCYGALVSGHFSDEFHPRGVAHLLLDVFFDCPTTLMHGELEPNLDAIIELVAGQFDLSALVLVLEESDQVARGELRVVQHFESALGGEVARLVAELGGFLRTRRSCGWSGILRAAPLEDVAAVQAPD